MNILKEINDNINILDETKFEITEKDDKDLLEKSFNKHIRSSKGGHFYTEIEGTNELGETVFKTHNELLLGGGLFVLMKLANINPPIDVQTMNIDLDINTQETETGYEGCRRDDAIFGFAVGTSGCTDVFDTVYQVKYKERTITSLVPFRNPRKDKDLTEEERSKYFLRKDKGDNIEYYIKLPEDKPKIFAVYDEEGNPAVPVNVDQLDDDRIINTYLQYVLKINHKDLREWFVNTGAGLRKCRINTLGLVHGYKEGEDYRGVKMFSKVNFNNEAFDNETKELTIKYKIYI